MNRKSWALIDDAFWLLVILNVLGAISYSLLAAEDIHMGGMKELWVLLLPVLAVACFPVLLSVLSARRALNKQAFRSTFSPEWLTLLLLLATYLFSMKLGILEPLNALDFDRNPNTIYVLWRISMCLAIFGLWFSGLILIKCTVLRSLGIAPSGRTTRETHT